MMEFLKKVSREGIYFIPVFKKPFICCNILSTYILLLTCFNMRAVEVNASEVVCFVAVLCVVI